MKLLFYHAALEQGGAERTIAALSGQFCGYGHEALIALCGSRPSYYTLDSRVQRRFLSPSPKESPFSANGSLILQLRALLRRERPDWLLVFDATTLAQGICAALGLKTRVLYAECSNPLRWPRRRFWRILRLAGMLLADRIVFQTARARDCFPVFLQRKASVIPNGLFHPALAGFVPPARREQAVCAMGRFSHEKGFDLLLAAFARLAPQFPGWELRIYGSAGDCREALERQLLSLGLSGRARLISGDENALLEAARGAVFALPSRYEGMPNALLEAMAAGMACVAADCPFGPRELIADGENGLLTPPEDCDALSAALARVLGDKALRKRLSKNAAAVRETYALQRVAASWLALLETP